MADIELVIKLDEEDIEAVSLDYLNELSTIIEADKGGEEK